MHLKIISKRELRVNKNTCIAKIVWKWVECNSNIVYYEAAIVILIMKIQAIDLHQILGTWEAPGFLSIYIHKINWFYSNGILYHF